MICEEKFLWKQLGEGMLLRALSPSFLGPLPPRPLGSGQPMVIAAVCYFVGHGARACTAAGGRQGSGAISFSPRWRHAAKERQSQSPEPASEGGTLGPGKVWSLSQGPRRREVTGPEAERGRG